MIEGRCIIQRNLTLVFTTPIISMYFFFIFSWSKFCLKWNSGIMMILRFFQSPFIRFWASKKVIFEILSLLTGAKLIQFNSGQCALVSCWIPFPQRLSPKYNSLSFGSLAFDRCLIPGSLRFVSTALLENYQGIAFQDFSAPFCWDIWLQNHQFCWLLNKQEKYLSRAHLGFPNETELRRWFPRHW